MRYATHFEVRAATSQVFDALHRYKVEADADRYFMDSTLRRIVHMAFRVVSPSPLGLGATYDWRFTVFGLPVFHFREQVVEWEEGRVVAYRAVRGWSMTFRTELEPGNGWTMVHTWIEFSTGLRLLDRLAKPFFEWGLRRVSAAMIARGLRAMGAVQSPRKDEEERSGLSGRPYRVGLPLSTPEKRGDDSHEG